MSEKFNPNTFEFHLKENKFIQCCAVMLQLNGRAMEYDKLMYLLYLAERRYWADDLYGHLYDDKFLLTEDGIVPEYLFNRRNNYEYWANHKYLSPTIGNSNKDFGLWLEHDTDVLTPTCSLSPHDYSVIAMTYGFYGHRTAKEISNAIKKMPEYISLLPLFAGGDDTVRVFPINILWGIAYEKHTNLLGDIYGYYYVESLTGVKQ